MKERHAEIIDAAVSNMMQTFEKAGIAIMDDPEGATLRELAALTVVACGAMLSASASSCADNSDGTCTREEYFDRLIGVIRQSRDAGFADHDRQMEEGRLAPRFAAKAKRRMTQ